MGGVEKGGGPGEGLRLIYRGRWYSRVAGLDQAGVDRLGDLGGVGGTLDGGTEVLVHERLGDLGQDLKVRGAGLGTRDEQRDGHVDGSAVHGVPTGHTGLVLDDDDGSLGNGVGLGMRDGEALHHARGALGLAGQEGVHHGVGVAGDTGLDSLVGNEAQSLVTRSEVLGDKDILDLHEVGSLGLGGLDGSGLGGLNGPGYRSGLLIRLEVVLLEGHEQDATDHSADEDREDPQRTVLDNGQDQEAAVRRRIVGAQLIALNSAAGFWGLIILTLWQQVGYMMIIYIAGLQSIPSDYIEAAKVDGATAWQTFWKVKIPNLMPTITICLFLSITNGFKLFDQNLALTGGAPAHSTEMLALNIYNTFYSRAGIAWQGIGQAKAVIFCILVVAISMIQLKATRSKEVQQ